VDYKAGTLVLNKNWYWRLFHFFTSMYQ